MGQFACHLGLATYCLPESVVPGRAGVGLGGATALVVGLGVASKAQTCHADAADLCRFHDAVGTRPSAVSSGRTPPVFKLCNCMSRIGSGCLAELYQAL